ncbi:MAG: helix-turn-helix, type 11 domain protein [Verrucomicrobiales bacterium]|nr:helix-turn-helix, type 11 domain protein [Verrucomicrobiales bacterium]
MAQFKRILKKHPEMPITKVAKKMKVDRRTLHRYLLQMKTAATEESKYSDADGRNFSEDFTYTDAEITESEMIALLVAQKDLKSRGAASLDRGITSTFKKIVSTASAKLVSKIKVWERVISFRFSGHARTDSKVFSAMAHAAGSHQEMTIKYRDPNGAETTRDIHLLNISNINGDWYGFAFDSLREWKVRCFNLCRIKEYSLTGKTYEYPEGWTLEKYLKNSFGVFSGDGEHHVVIRFRGKVADLIREKEWRCQTDLIELGNGVVELHLTVNGLFEVFLWVMEWGCNAKVVSPPELRGMVENEIKAMMEAYADSSW